MATCFFITHPQVVIDPAVPVPDWPLTEVGRERMRRFAGSPLLAGVRGLFCSSERKAIEGATILADARDLPVRRRAALGENDRSATGYLAKAAFERAADAFFARPEASMRGWERAVDAQARIVAAIAAALAEAPEGDVAIVAHGGVGALLLCHLLGAPISRRHDQPGEGGGNVLTFTRAPCRLLHAWRPIDGLAAD
jgi:broad specificity phosphatase PhoE